MSGRLHGQIEFIIYGVLWNGQRNIPVVVLSVGEALTGLKPYLKFYEERMMTKMKKKLEVIEVARPAATPQSR